MVGFRNTYRMYHGDVFSNHGEKPYPLTNASQKLNDVSYRLDGKPYKLAGYLKNQSVTGLLLLKDGKIAYEYYDQGSVQWDENYASKDSDFSRMTQCEARPNPYDCVLQLVRSVKRKPGVKPGEVWSYNTGGAWLVGRVLENATGMTIAKYLESRILGAGDLWADHCDQPGRAFGRGAVVDVEEC